MFYQVDWGQSLHHNEAEIKDEREQKLYRATGSLAVKLEIWNTHPRTVSQLVWDDP